MTTIKSECPFCAAGIELIQPEDRLALKAKSRMFEVKSINGEAVRSTSYIVFGKRASAQLRKLLRLPVR